MISSREELKETLEAERRIYWSRGLREKIYDCIFQTNSYKKWKFISASRKLELLQYEKKWYHFLWRYILLYRVTRLQRELGIELSTSSFGKGLVIHHTVGIVVNGNAKIGDNCILHGGNVIGNRGVG